MFDSQIKHLHNGLISLAFVAAAAWLAAPIAYIDPVAAAAEVDAIGVRAPIDFADVVERVKPAVVGVRVRIEGVMTSDETQKEATRSPFDRFLHHFGIPMPDARVPKSGFALGSGFFISGDGYVVTNNHVVANGTSFEVTTDNGKTYQAKVIGTDPQTDLALIKVIGGGDFPYVRLAAEVPRVGEWVLPVGNPFGLGGTVTAGIVSARGRDIGAGPYEDFIQIDAPVNKGNSGGPSFNVRGEVIGVNTAIFSPSGGSVGVAFDIPAETVKLIVQQLKDKGHVTRGWIGVQVQEVTPTIAESIG
jgi:serine protease Do